MGISGKGWRTGPDAPVPSCVSDARWSPGPGSANYSPSLAAVYLQGGLQAWPTPLHLEADLYNFPRATTETWVTFCTDSLQGLIPLC